MEIYNLVNEKKRKSKEEVLHNADELFDTRRKIFKAFEDGIFPLSKENLHKEQTEEEKKEEKKKKQFLIG